MASPVGDSYSAASGATIYAGRNAPAAYPAWRVGRPLNEWHEIPNTGGAGGAELEEYSGWALARGTILVSAASGGHNLSDNRVVSIDLAADTPSWLLRHAPSTVVARDVTHYADGTPISRHTRYNTQWSSALNRVLLVGARDQFSVSPGAYPDVDGFNLDTNEWDAAGTWPPVAGGSSQVNGGACVDANGDIWTSNCVRKLTVSTLTWSTPLTSQAADGCRYPWARAAARNMMFGLCYGDGFGGSGNLGDGGIVAVRVVGNVQTAITFNPSAAKTQFQADKPPEAGMDYDPINDWFLFYSGTIAGRVYKVIPNNTAVWDIEIFSYGAGNVMPIAAIAATQSKFTYVSSLKGFVHLPSKASNLQFMATAN